MEDYFRSWYLKPNPNKTVACIFHLNNSEAHRTLNLSFCGRSIAHEEFPKYLGVTLDRSLTYKRHLQQTANKVQSRNNILSRLAGTSWGSGADALRTSAMALCYSTAEYCAPVWARSTHVKLLDTKLNQTMRIVSGTLRSTPLPWLPVLTNITPPDLRRKAATQKKYRKLKTNPQLPIHQILNKTPPARLTSRRPFWTEGAMLDAAEFSAIEEWRALWTNTNVTNSTLIQDPTLRPPGFNLPRKKWSALNRLRTGHGRCRYFMHRWGLCDHPYCDCSTTQTMTHIVESCPIYGFEGGLPGIHQASEEALHWLSNLDIDL